MLLSAPPLHLGIAHKQYRAHLLIGKFACVSELKLPHIVQILFGFLLKYHDRAQHYHNRRHCSFSSRVNWPKFFLSHQDLLRSEEHTSELQSRFDLVCRLLLEKKKINSTSLCTNYDTTSTPC